MKKKRYYKEWNDRPDIGRTLKQITQIHHESMRGRTLTSDEIAECNYQPPMTDDERREKEGFDVTLGDRNQVRG